MEEEKERKIKKKLLKTKNGEGRVTYRLIIPKDWVEDMKISENDSISLEYDESKKEIIIRK